ncbi:phage antirepressor N-terminal domain-containing protein [Photorhabdus cinerea]|uniref:Phage antirepressor Ant n=1 Tax=Photorhabdus cinerea TaxID=471575 RepID=A0A7X5QI25_9GAMM|nr:phage antirepressor N-terminal domain-containing protein [Photorhabdus cinerea]NHB94689.1 phage antirepressor Ant [Photorhabdus cinerea]
MSSIAINAIDNTINVPFHGNDLYVVNHNGEPYVPMKPIVDGMELTWQPQLEKLKTRFSKGITEIVIPTKGGLQSMTCLALRKLAGWLSTISPNKVKASIREKVIQYQEECDDVLYEYWTKGEVTKKTKTTTDERTPLRDAVNMLVGKKGLMYPEACSFIHQRFNVSHIDQLPAERIPEAIEYVHKLVLDGEYLGKQQELPAPPKIQFTDDELCSLCWLWRDAVEMISSISDVYPILKAAEHKLEGKYYSMSREYPRNMNIARRLLERETAHIECASFTYSDWRVLHNLRIPNSPF